MSSGPTFGQRRSVRLPPDSYVLGGSFFLTICTDRRQALFGVIDDGAMRMNELGWIVWEEWERTGLLRAEVELVAHVVMPNHFHALFSLRPTVSEDEPRVGGLQSGLHRLPRSLGSLVAGFKSSCTIQINRVRQTPGIPVWQRGYWDHIVRDESAFGRIYEYIVTNPLRWHDDSENPDRRQNR